MFAMNVADVRRDVGFEVKLGWIQLCLALHFCEFLYLKECMVKRSL